MILVTGGTGFIGRALVRQLVEAGYEVRTLIRPSPDTPRLPKGVPVEVAVASLNDVRGLRAAMRGVDVIYHLAGGEGKRDGDSLFDIDIEGTRNLVEAAAETGIQRIIYISHLDADRASAFPVLKAKGIAEEHIRKSGIPYTILQASAIFGPEDNFTIYLDRLIRMSVGIFPLPNGGKVILQPLWIEDLVTCMLWSLDTPETLNKTYAIGGSEYFTLRQITEVVLRASGRRRLIVPMSSPFLRMLTVFLEQILPKFPASGFLLDYFATDRTCEVDTLPRIFGLMPARFTYRLDYLTRPSLREKISKKR